MSIETQLSAAEKIANREPEEESDPEQELDSDEMDRIDERNANRFNGI
jgi:hypothetical protein